MKAMMTNDVEGGASEKYVSGRWQRKPSHA